MLYSAGMVKQYSITEAQRSLSNLVDEATSGAEVLLSQRGRPVAVLVSMARYAELKRRRGSFAEAYAGFRATFATARAGLTSEHFRSLRDRGAGRQVAL